MEVIIPDNHTWGDPMLGDGFKSINDTVFSVGDGYVKRIKKFSNRSSVTILYKNDISVTYGFIANTFVKVGDYILKEKPIGTLRGKREVEFYILAIFIKIKSKYLRKEQYPVFFKQCVDEKL